jgi:hypothetical protein
MKYDKMRSSNNFYYLLLLDICPSVAWGALIFAHARDWGGHRAAGTVPVTRGLPGRLAACGGLLLRAAAGSRLAWVDSALLEWFRLHASGPLLGKFWFLPRFVDLRLLSSQADSPCQVWRDALDGLTVVATLVHELF